MDIIAKDKQHVWHPFTQMEEWDPLVIERGKGCYLYDTAGNKYFDGVSSLWTNVHGHGREEIDRAIIEQLGRIAHTTLLGLANPPSAILAEKLALLAPGDLDRVFYSDSGSTAVEIALKIAFQYWQLRGYEHKKQFVYLENSYHGDTLGAVSVGGIPIFHAVFGDLTFPALKCPTPYTLRHPGDNGCVKALAALEKILDDGQGTIAALIIEPLVQGAAGILVQPTTYVSKAHALCQKYDVLFIADEVATGFGRTGAMFACEQEDVVPDLMCVAKGLTGGYLPLAATIARNHVFEAFLGAYGDMKHFFHGHTYTGNALACAAAIANLDLFASDNTIAGLEEKVSALATALQPLENHPEVLEIRQKGLMVGIELGRKFNALPADARPAARVCEKIRENGVILRNLGDVVVLMPPLCSTSEQLVHVVDVISRALDAMGA